MNANISKYVRQNHAYVYNLFFFFLFFCWAKVHFVGPLIAPILDFV